MPQPSQDLRSQIYLTGKLETTAQPPKAKVALKRHQSPSGAGKILPPLEESIGPEQAKKLRHSLKNASSPKDNKIPNTPAGVHSQLQPIGRADTGSGPALRGGNSAKKIEPESSNSSLQLGKAPGAGKQTIQNADGLGYVKLIYTLREFPNTEDFVYLRRIDRNTSEYNPYALEVVPFSQVNPGDYYTLSVRGIAHYMEGVNVDFTSLDQWERELQLFNSLKTLKLFQLYKLWKGFRLWKRAVRLAKIAAAKEQLQKNLFVLSPVFQQPLSNLHRLCTDLSGSRLYKLQPSKTYTLEEFIEMQDEHRTQCMDQLVSFGEATYTAVAGACTADLTRLETKLEAFHTSHKEVEGDRETGDQRTALPPVGAAKDEGASDANEFAYTIAAARRSEQRRLVNFIRMADYVITDTLHAVLVQSAKDVLEFMQPTPLASLMDSDAVSRQHSLMPARVGQRVLPSLSLSLSMMPAPLPGNVPRRVPGLPLFEIELLLEDQDNSLLFQPHPRDYEERMLEVLGSFVEMLCTLRRLLSNEELLSAVFNGGEPDVEEGTSLEDLVAGPDYHELVTAVKESLEEAFFRASEHLSEYQPFIDMVSFNMGLDINSMGPDFKNKGPPLSATVELMQQLQQEEAGGVEEDMDVDDEGLPPKPDVTLESFRCLMDLLRDQKERMVAQGEVADVGIIRVNISKLKAAMLPSPTCCLDALHKLVPRLSAELLGDFVSNVQSACSRLSMRSTSVEDYVEKITFLDHLKSQEKLMDAKWQELHDIYHLIEEYAIPVPEIDKAAFATLDGTFNSLKTHMEEVDGNRDDNIQKYNTELDAAFEVITKEVKELRNSAQHEMILNEDSEHDKVVNYLSGLKEQCEKASKEVGRINKYQSLFKVTESRMDELSETTDEVQLKLNLWTGGPEFEEITNGWKEMHFEALDLQNMEETINKFNKMVFRMERGLPPNKLVPKFRTAVDDYRALLPVVQALRNKALKERHWQKVFDIIGTPIMRDETFSLQVLVDAKVAEYKDALQAVSTEATQEVALEELLAKVVGRWAGIEFNVLSYKESKDVFILGGIDEVQAALEDSMLTMATILSSRFVAGIRSEVERVEHQLALFSETLEEWVAVQKGWMYLEPIFSAPDIQRQLPSEAKAFFVCDKQLRDIMRRTKDRPNALHAGTQPGLLELFQKTNDTLEKIQKNLEDYLETKRMSFPRFYFLSNDELLEILAQTRNVQAVQPHMGKCFDGIRRLDFGEDPKSIDILAMISGEGERVGLGKNLKARGGVEKWLGDVESSMIQSLRKMAKAGFQSYPEEARTEWVLRQPAQLVIAVSQIFWCHGVEAKLRSEDPVPGIADFYQVNIRQLADLTKLVRGDLTGLHRRILGALITIDVHARDIVEALVKTSCKDINDFDWQMQLRYYFEDDDIIVRQVNARFLYAYEYLGAQARLVVTPMTDRCYLTLTGALHLKLGGAPAGPAGTGKTETTKDLGKALGVNCVVFNCGDNLDYRFMAKFFSGLAQCGAWACFDEFNRIDIEVLSVVAQQLLTIQNALKASLNQFMFEGRQIKLVATCGVFITMNPGYAGRTELPDNLKALFRPMAMMIPDYALVAEVMLFSEGFEDSKTLSCKMVKLYKLSSEQLSQQDHYDFGMRAVKSVLVMAGALKRANPDMSEDVVLIRAMRDSNLPKFLADDVELFQNIILDLFPGTKVPDQDYGELEQSIRYAMEHKQLQQPNLFVEKVIQLYETMNVRFGVMLVGPSGGGKTVCYQTLQGAMTRLRKDLHHKNDKYQLTHTYTFNPKCIKMGELYGEYNLLTNEWTDGLGSTLIRSAVADTTQDRKWVVFDGPVDAIWIENMNTVLDDNCTLCLPNGERIKLNPNTMRMLFEVQDLAVASPATVSRCGMVYIDASVLGWRPYVLTWAATQLGPECTPDIRAYILSLFEQFVDLGLEWIREHGKQHIPMLECNLTASLALMLQSLLSPDRGFKPSAAKSTEDLQSGIARLFAFCYTWALGGNLTATVRDDFDTFVRDLFAAIVVFPGGGLVYDYFADLKSFPTVDLRAWTEVVPTFGYNKALPFFQILVPTMDTARYSFLLELALDVGRSVLFTGVTGVGKSVITVDALERLRGSKGWLPHTLNFSAQTSALDTQLLIEGKLEKKRKTKFGAPPGKRVVFFVDDVNMPAKETYGAQPPIELLRQFQDFRGFYDRKKLFWKDIEDTTLVAACAPPGGGRQEVTPRFLRHFTSLCIPPPSDSCTKTILSAIFNGFLQDFPPDLRQMSNPLVAASVEAYSRISEELLPTPAKSHYTFNLRDLSKVFQGLLMLTPGTCPNRDVLLRAWVHESCRVFHDRLISHEDKHYFCHMLCELINKHSLGSADYDSLFVNRNVIFGDFMRPGIDKEERVYEEVADYNKLVNLLEDYLDEYNLSHPAALSLVFFQDAVEHITRIARVLRQPRGNAMLVGVGGSGKSSLTRFAAFIGGFKTVNIELRRGYGSTEFREDLKALYRTAGIDGTPVVFLFSDTQIVTEGFLEDINNMLNSGEVPGMFAQDEKDRIVNEVRDWVLKAGGIATKEGCYAAFINRVRDNLHIVLTMSPVGEAFRARCRQFPSLINCCAIDWFSQWPEEALLSVSTKFLQSVDLGSPEVRSAVATMCGTIHTSVAQSSDKFYNELRRRFYTTPKSYLDLISLYLALLAEKREELGLAKDRLLNGLRKLNETNDMIDGMKADLAELQPVLESKSQATAELLVKVSADQEAAEKMKALLATEEKDIKKLQLETSAIAADAKADLDEAMPALSAAMDSLKALNKNDIVEIKSFAKPPPLVQMTMEAVCILKGEAPSWDGAKKMLGDTNFMKSLEEFDKENISDATIRKLKKYVDDPSYTPEAVAKQSKAAMSLCMWTRAMDVYHRVAQVVEPKRQKLREAENALEAANKQLQEKQELLRATEAQVDELRAQLATAQREQRELGEQADLTKKRLERAAKLTSALADEGVRWGQTAESISEQHHLLVGDVFLAAACIAYFGAFTGPYRQALVESWVAACIALQIPVSADFALRSTLASPVEVREWNIAGLPSDSVSVDNGILVTRGRRWPLMIDPQGQANNWIKNMETKSGLRIIKLTDGTFLRTLENCIRIGTPVLIEDVGEALDPALEPVLAKAIFKQGGRTLIRLGDSDVDYDPAFKLYITTKMANPHYLPEVCIKVTIINFTVTMEGLEDQLLGEVVRKERPDLEEAKDRLVVSIANDKRQLKELEDKILKLLKESEGNILDDEQLINTLNNSKLTSGMIAGRVKEAEVTERSINETREHYRPAATRGSVLYFVMADLALISPMYQFSLTYFIRLFSYCIDKSEKSDDVPTRLELLSSFMTSFTFNNVQRGLFEEHKGLFAFLVCTAILRHPSSGEIDPSEWNFLLRGPVGGIQAGKPKPGHSWLTETMWQSLLFLDGNVAGFEGIVESVTKEPNAWRSWLTSVDPHTKPLPAGWHEKCEGFKWLCLIRVFVEEKLVFACQSFVESKHGREFTEPAPWTLDDVFPDTSWRAPIIFILSTGADPTAMLQRFAEKKGFTPGEKLHMISLGQGQGPVAEMMMTAAAKAGEWVCLQNCHLASSWMLRLEEKAEELGREGSATHPDFRLWLTSMPSKVFPVLVLQNGTKLTNEPPKGVKANIYRTFNDMTPANYASCTRQPEPWRRLLFSLAFFHAVVQERRKFGPLGWNIRYEFNASDLECSSMTLRMFLEEQENIPWPALEYVIGQINYGGRVTDDLDRRCLMSILRQYITPRVLQQDYTFTPSGIYRVPGSEELDYCREYIRNLPSTEAPEVFGMHPNANITFQLQETRKLIDQIVSIQPRLTSGAAGKGPDEVVGELAAEMLSSLPPMLGRNEAAQGLFDRTETGQLNSLSVVLGQEMDRFNRLTNRMNSTLVELQKAIKGLVVMSGELELMYNSLLSNQVPALWAKVAYPSLKPLGSWMKDYHKRITFMRSWLTEGVPKCFWLPGFFFPQGFMTGVLQMHARKYSIPIDTLNFGFHVTQQQGPEEVEAGPEDGILVDGLYVDNARWLRGPEHLEESEPGIMYAPLPVIHFVPQRDYDSPVEQYQCPLYKTSVRAGILSTTGQSTNFILCVSLPIRPGTTPDFWILQGVALLCMLDE